MRLNLYCKFYPSLLLRLDKRVFGNITTKQVIGAYPTISDARDIFERELGVLLAEMTSLSRKDLEKILEEQELARDHINSRPGAMALAQSKIHLFNEYNQKYVESIREEMHS